MVLADHVVNLVLTWALCHGFYNPIDKFKDQEEQVFEFLLSHQIPAELINPIYLVRVNLGRIFSIRKLKNSSRMRINRKRRPVEFTTVPT
jgi:hypothetical protein